MSVWVQGKVLSRRDFLSFSIQKPYRWFLLLPPLKTSSASYCPCPTQQQNKLCCSFDYEDSVNHFYQSMTFELFFRMIFIQPKSYLYLFCDCISYLLLHNEFPPNFDSFKTASVHYFIHFLRIRNLGATFLGGSGVLAKDCCNQVSSGAV